MFAFNLKQTSDTRHAKLLLILEILFMVIVHYFHYTYEEFEALLRIIYHYLSEQHEADITAI